MDEQTRQLEDLKHIRQMMERSSRFISLSGFSGIAAGLCALAGVWFAKKRIDCWTKGDCSTGGAIDTGGIQLLNELLWIATLTFIGAFVLAFFFTWLRSRKTKLPLWGSASIRLCWNILVPFTTGALFIIRLLQLGEYEVIAPACLIFYGLSLVNASKYTLGEVRYLGYGQIALGLMSLWNLSYGLYFWGMGFGILHIIYGLWMWNKYERIEG